MLILGIETTCDETAAAVVEDGRVVHASVVSSQVELHAKFGGVVPEIASRAHLEQLHALIQEAMDQAGVTGPELGAVAVANAPGLIGCLLVGTAAAKALAFAWDKPLVAVNHVQAHLYSVVLEEREQREQKALRGADAAAGAPSAAPASLSALVPQCLSASPLPPLPAVGLVISGGHSSMYHVRAFDDLVRIGSTHDDAVGEAFDKVAAILQLGYPGGPLVDALAREGDPHAVAFPVPLLEKDSLDFSFSGLKTSVLYHVNGKQGRERDASALSRKEKADVAASFQRVVSAVIAEKLRRAAERIGARSVIVGGGVSANSALRGAVVELGRSLGLPVYIPPMRYCTDNAAMIAGLAYPLLQAGKVADLDMETIATV